MKLVRSCQHSSFCFSVSHSCALTDFPTYSTGCFFKGKHHIQNLSGSSLRAQSSTRSAVSRILQSRSNSFGQGLGNAQLTEPHVLFATDAMHVAGSTCVCCWLAGTVVADTAWDRCCSEPALLRWGKRRLWSETWDVLSRNERKPTCFSLLWRPMSSTCPSTPFSTASFVWKTRKEQKALGGQGKEVGVQVWRLTPVWGKKKSWLLCGV